MVINLEFYYARYGALARPYDERVGFNYNRVYNTFDDIIQDFNIHGWKLVSNEDFIYTFTNGD